MINRNFYFVPLLINQWISNQLIVSTFLRSPSILSNFSPQDFVISSTEIITELSIEDSVNIVGFSQVQKIDEEGCGTGGDNVGLIPRTVIILLSGEAVSSCPSCRGRCRILDWLTQLIIIFVLGWWFGVGFEGPGGGFWR